MQEKFEKLFWKIFNCDKEEDLHKIVIQDELLRNNNNWFPYGNNKGNHGTFGSQQYHPVPALVEKVTNSIDAILIKECKLKGINPESKDAPRTMKDAVELFYEVKNGEIGELDEKSRRKLAENIQVLALGDKDHPSIIVYDNGEGQLPKDFSETFLSLHTNNKTKVHFVQGKYNMGSAGAVIFCGENYKYQLIASKKNTNLSNNPKFGFTLVRRHPLSDEESENRKSTWYEYFCLKNEIPSFDIDSIDIGLHNRKFENGSIVKLYSYQLTRGSRSDITLGLWRDLNQYMFDLPLPVILFEKRDYKGKTPTKPLLGNKTRIDIDSRKKVEKIIQSNIPQNSKIGEINIDSIIFDKSTEHNEFINHKSIIFTVNGQVHGFEGQSFISQTLGFQLLKKYMLIHVDCTKISTTNRDDIFMSNRTQLQQGSKTEELKNLIIDILRNNDWLKQLNNERKNEILQDDDTNTELLSSLLSKLPVDKDLLNLLKKDGNLSFLEKKGEKIKPTKSDKTKELNRFPSIFNLKYNDSGPIYKTIPINGQGKVMIETDVEDDYLFRPHERGKFEIQIMQKRNRTETPVEPNPKPNPNVVIDVITVEREGPSSGTIKLIIKPNNKAHVGDEIDIKAKLSTPGDDLSCIFTVKVDEKISPPKEKKKENTETFPNLPKPQKAYKSPKKDSNGVAWSKLRWNGEDIVKIVHTIDNETNDILAEGIIVNMDAFVLMRFISKNKIKSEKELKYTKDKYFLSIYLHSLFLFSILEKMRKDDDKLKILEIDEFISSMIKPYSNFLLYENHHITQMAFDD